MTFSGTVLVVDDDQAAARMAQMVLEDGGYTVFTAPNVDVALKRLSMLTPSVILVDINMPAENGYSFCLRVRRDYRDIKCPIVFFTSDSTTATLAAARKVGGDYFVSKPFTSRSLLTAIRRSFQVYAARRMRSSKIQSDPYVDSSKG